MKVYENPWFSVVKEGKYHYISENKAEPGAAVLVFHGDNLVLLNMKRAAQQGETTLEIPRGYAEEGETLIECAIREVREETGYQIEETDLTFLGYVRPNTSILESKIGLFLARVPNHNHVGLRDDEADGITLVNRDSITDMSAKGLLEDAFFLSAYAKASLLGLL